MHSITRYKTVPLRRDFIPSLGEPSQQVLWIGCSDSGFEETTTLDLLRDETIVIRNIGNIFLDDDLTCMSMVQYAIDILQVSRAFRAGFWVYLR
jgi:carbonic anhydrase